MPHAIGTMKQRQWVVGQPNTVTLGNGDGAFHVKQRLRYELGRNLGRYRPESPADAWAPYRVDHTWARNIGGEHPIPHASH